jgi:hypothetical protein
MAKFWPLVLWFRDIEGADFVYVPSFSHHFDDTEKGNDQPRPVQPYDTYAEARAAAIRMVVDLDRIGSKDLIGALGVFKPSAIESETMPDYMPSHGKIVVRVTKFAVNEDGDIAANVQHITGEE